MCAWHLGQRRRRRSMPGTWRTRCGAKSWMRTRSRTRPRWCAMKSIRSTTCAVRLATNARWRGSGRSARSRSCWTAVHSLELELLTRGHEAAPRLLFLHDLDYLNHTDHAFVASRSEERRVGKECREQRVRERREEEQGE